MSTLLLAIRRRCSLSNYIAIFQAEKALNIAQMDEQKTMTP